MSVRIVALPALKDNFIYVLVHGAHCAVIDPGETPPVDKFLQAHQLRLDAILCTHHHWDHVTGVPELAARHGCEVWVSDPDRARVPGATKVVAGLAMLWEYQLEILAVPGHTLGQIAYYFPELGAVFPGDTLFSAGCGRLFEGTPAMMFASLKKLAALPAETKIYFGHEYTLRNLEFVAKYEAAPPAEVESYRAKCERMLAAGSPTTPSTVAEELKINPFLKAEDVETFTKWRELRNTW